MSCSQEAKKFVVASNMVERQRLGQNMESIDEDEAWKEWLLQKPYLQEYKKVSELVKKLPSKTSSGHTIVDRSKDMALGWEFYRARMSCDLIYGCFGDFSHGFFLNRPVLAMPKRCYPQSGYIDVDKARAAWRADIEVGIRRPDHYYVSQEFYTKEKKEKIAKHAAAVALAQADKSFWAFSLL